MVRDAVRDHRDDLPAPPTPGFWRMTGRALRLKCCVCGQGKLFKHWTAMVERCPQCGYLFERAEGQFIGAVGMNTIITFGTLLIVEVIAFILTSPDIPAVPLAGLALAIAILMPIAIYPLSKTTWTAIDLLMTPLEPGEAPVLAAQLAGRADPAAVPGPATVAAPSTPAP